MLVSNRRAKLTVLQALRRSPDFSGIAALPAPGTGKGLSLLQWMDKSGLALNFLGRVRDQGITTNLPSGWREVLERREQSNALRFKDMLAEFCRLNDAFRSRGILAVTLKGFSLVPDFCEDPSLRHQTDFDFLAKPSDVENVAETLQTFGYSTALLSRSEETCFTTPLLHVPSSKDDVYALQPHRQVDLHVSISENSPWLQMDFPSDCLERSIPSTLLGVEFHSLSLADRFLTQVLHLFRHSFRSWIRLSWALELARCIEVHRNNICLWESVIDRAGNKLVTRRIFAFVLSLANRLFQCQIPSPMWSWASEGLTPSMQAWMDHFSIEWAISDWPGSLSNLFLASDFIPENRLRNEYLKSRLLPQRARMSIEVMPSLEKKKSAAWKFLRWQYVAHRSLAHLRDLCCLPLEQIKWKRALAAAGSKQYELESSIV